MAKIWKNKPENEGSAKNLVYRLRRKISGSEYTITSKRGKGYLFEKKQNGDGEE